jgi:hypothetical protein
VTFKDYAKSSNYCAEIQEQERKGFCYNTIFQSIDEDDTIPKHTLNKICKGVRDTLSCESGLERYLHIRHKLPRYYLGYPIQ